MSTKLMSCLAGLALAGLIIFSQIALAESVIEKGLTSSKSADFSQGLFNPNKLVSIEIQMAPADWEFVRTDGRNYSWKKAASVTVNGTVLENVGIRKKGLVGSVNSEKPALKLKFDKYIEEQLAFGMERMILNNNVSDPSFIKQYLTYGLFRKAGMPAPLCNFAIVRVNGEDLGLYTNVEPIKKPFLLQHFTSSKGDLYEGTMSDFRQEWMNTFENKTKSSDKEKTRIKAITKTLALPDDRFMEEISKLVDLEAFCTYWALEVLLTHADGFTNKGNNYFVYFDPGSDKMYAIPWGVDKTFIPSSYKLPRIYTKTALPSRLYSLPQGRKMYFEALRTLLTDVWNEGAILAEINRLETQLTPVVAADLWYTTAKDWEGNPADFTTSLNLVRNFVKARRSETQRIIDNPPNWKNLLATGRKQNKGNKAGLKYNNKSSGSEGNKNTAQQQVEGWINYLRTTSESQAHQAIQSQKFRALDSKVQWEILNRAKELKLNLSFEEMNIAKKLGLKELREDRKVGNEPSKDEKLKALYDKMLREDPDLKEHSVTFEQLRPRLEHMLREDEAERGVEKKNAQNEQQNAATIQKKVDEFLREIPEVARDIQAQNIARENLEWMILVGETIQEREGHASGYDKARAKHALKITLEVMIDADKLKEKQAAELYEIVFPKNIDWGARYEAYLKANPAVAGAVKSGKITKDNVLAGIKAHEGERSPTEEEQLEALYQKLLKEDRTLGRTPKAQLMPRLKAMLERGEGKTLRPEKSTRQRRMTYGLYFNELIESGQIERFDKDLKRVHDIGSAEILRQGKKKR